MFISRPTGSFLRSERVFAFRRVTEKQSATVDILMSLSKAKSRTLRLGWTPLDVLVLENVGIVQCDAILISAHL